MSNIGCLGDAVLLVLDELSEVDHEAPGVGTQSLETLEEDCRDLLLDVGLGFFEKSEKSDAEEESVRVGVA